MTTVTNIPKEAGTESQLHIQDRRLLVIAQVAWLLILLVVIWVMIATTPIVHQWLITIMQGSPSSELSRLRAELIANYITTIRTITMLTYLAGAFIIFYLRSDHWVAWLSSLALILLSVTPNAALNFFNDAQPNLRGVVVFLYFVSLSVSVSFLYIFPDGRLVPSWTKWILIAYAVWEFFRIIYAFFVAGDLRIFDNIIWSLPLIATMVLGIGVRVYRYRHSSATQKQQTKWVGFGSAILCLAVVLDFLPGTAIDNPSAFASTLLVTHTLLNLSGIVLVICMGIAITRYRLWDINIVINRSLVYGLVTLVLAGTFLGVALVLQSLLGTEQTGVAFAASLLVAGALFNPARRRAQHFIDRRFYRFRFDLNQLADAQKPLEIKNPGLLTGRTLGAYQVLGVLGKGGMGEVYQGQDAQETVAIKILPNDLALDSAFRARFEREAQTLTRLKHPNIVKFYDWGESEGILYIALEFVDGQDLGNLLQQSVRFSFEEISPFIAELAYALDYVHAAGFVHRDIKPSNIMLRLRADHTTREVVLMDFGVAKVLDAETGLTGTGAVGTIGYMAPEQITSAREVDQRADIYALGIVLFELLTGERPFKGSPAQVLFAHLQQLPPDPRWIISDIPAHVADAVTRAISKDPQERFQTAGEFATALLST
jgi:serine/threonine-protein kinase